MKGETRVTHEKSEQRAAADGDSLAALRREIIARGWNRKATFRIVSELVCAFAIAMCGIWIFVVY